MTVSCAAYTSTSFCETASLLMVSAAFAGCAITRTRKRISELSGKNGLVGSVTWLNGLIDPACLDAMLPMSMRPSSSLMALFKPDVHPHGLQDDQFTDLFTRNTHVVFAFARLVVIEAQPGNLAGRRLGPVRYVP